MGRSSGKTVYWYRRDDGVGQRKTGQREGELRTKGEESVFDGNR